MSQYIHACDAYVDTSMHSYTVHRMGDVEEEARLDCTPVGVSTPL